MRGHTGCSCGYASAFIIFFHVNLLGLFRAATANLSQARSNIPPKRFLTDVFYKSLNPKSKQGLNVHDRKCC